MTSELEHLIVKRILNALNTCPRGTNFHPFRYTTSRLWDEAGVTNPTIFDIWSQKYPWLDQSLLYDQSFSRYKVVDNRSEMPPNGLQMTLNIQQSNVPCIH